MLRGKTMYPDDVVEEEFGEVRGIDLRLSRDKVCHLRKSIDYYENSIIRL